MTIHTQLKELVGRQGAGILNSPYLYSIMADEKMFTDADNRPYRPLFRMMTSNDHVRQIGSVWRSGRPSVTTYSSSYPGVEQEHLRYAIDCIGYAMGTIDTLSSVVTNQGEITQAVDLKSDTVEYISHGSSNNIGTLIPSVMAQPIHRYLNEIANEEGSVIEFVRKELCEATTDDIRKKISGEQIDGVALAMRQMIDGRAFILGDMTGIGKGRQLAMLLKWAQRHGERPVFVTEKSILFNDLYRDLEDIGYGDMRPFILNSDPSARITNRAGGIVYNLPTHDEMAEFRTTGNIPSGYDFLLTTYSQLNKPTDKSWKPAAVLSAIKGTYLLLDESHNASGIESNTGLFFREAVKEARGVCFASATYAKYPSSMPIYAMKTAMGLAKIPPQDLLEIVAHGGPILQEVMAQGLVESGSMIRRQRDMSEVERIIATPQSPVVIDSLRSSYDKIIALIDDIRDFYKKYLKVYTGFKDPISILSSKCKISPAERWVTNECEIKDWNPQQRLAPAIRQLLFALKTEFAIEKTLEEIKAGRKPIVQISRTMSSNISRIMTIGHTYDTPDFAMILQNCVDDIFRYEVTGQTMRAVGKKIVTKDYSTSCTYSFSDVIDFFNSNEWLQSGISTSADKTAAEAQACYDLLLKNIHSMLTGLPISPIDYFVQRLSAEGIRVAELTQRNVRLVYDDVLAGPNSRVTCQKRKACDKKRAAAEFNNGSVDVLIGNRVMASGISLHNHEGVGDIRPRTIITWEQQDSADLQTQFDGRADRTGQLDHCKYVTLTSPVPIEHRYLMMHNRKQRSLNANVEANQGRDNTCVDLFNKYGVKVINEFTEDNPEYSDTTLTAGEKMNSRSRKTTALTNSKSAQFVSNFMRDLGLLVCSEQETILREIMERYQQLIDSLEANGENDLNTGALPLRAERIGEKVFYVGKKDASSPFSRDAVITEYEVDVLRKPLSSREIKEHISTLADKNCLIPRIDASTNLKIERIGAYYNELRTRALTQLSKLKSAGSYTPSRLKALEERANNFDRMNMEIATIRLSKDNLLSLMNFFTVGHTYSIPSIIIPDGQLDDPGYASSVPVGIFMGYKVIGNKYTPSSLQAIFAVNDSRSIVRVSMSDKASLETIQRQSSLGVSLRRNCTINLGNWDSTISTKNREKAYIITGNILAGIAKCNLCRKNVKKSKLSRLVSAMTVGRIVKYTDLQGNICTGYKLPRLFHPQLFFNNITI